MIEKMIKASKDFELRTYAGVHFLVKGEVKRIRFKNQQVFEGLLRYGNFVEAKVDEKEVKVIPVIQPPVEKNTIVTIVEDKQELPFVEAIQDNLDEADEPVGKETLEDLSQTDEQVDSTEDVDIDKPDLPCPEKDHTTIEEYLGKVAPEDASEMGFEEIPIEEQDESKPELKSDEVVDDWSGG